MFLLDWLLLSGALLCCVMPAITKPRKHKSKKVVPNTSLGQSITAGLYGGWVPETVSVKDAFIGAHGTEEWQRFLEQKFPLAKFPKLRSVLDRSGDLEGLKLAACVVCGDVFEVSRRDKETCSPECANVNRVRRCRAKAAQYNQSQKLARVRGKKARK
jgi:predicted RNA-binding Zn-ribbon protein involved in translation (DUF1610 family)